ncbi:MAG TPA: hypothetical protein DD640_02665 [Clostridiales bacterium]|nr:hypothetical protein [Clostridiales bacterium]
MPDNPQPIYIKIPRRNLSDEVYAQVKANIISRAWKPGSKIPSENEMMQLFGVSRVSIRPAIQRLAGMGVLDVRRGDGTYVTELGATHLMGMLLPFLTIGDTEIIDVLEFRSILETESARLAAKMALPAQIRNLRDCIGKMKAAEGDYDTFSRHDLEFHLGIAEATGNSLIIKVNKMLHDLLDYAMREVVAITGFEDGISYHTRIADALEMRDAEKAAAEMRGHIETIIQKFIAHAEAKANQPGERRTTE